MPSPLLISVKVTEPAGAISLSDFSPAVGHPRIACFVSDEGVAGGAKVNCDLAAYKRMVKTPVVLSVKVANEIEAVGAGTTAAVLPVTDLIVAFVVFGVKRIPTGDIAFIIRVRGLFAVAVIENDAVNISGDIEGILRFVVIIVACGRHGCARPLGVAGGAAPIVG